MFVTRRSPVQQAIREPARDMRLMNPVSLVENYSACRKNWDGKSVGKWSGLGATLVASIFCIKILAEANTLLQLEDGPPRRPFKTRKMFQCMMNLKPLTRAELEKLTKSQRKAYYDELEYKKKLFMKKKLKEEKKWRKMKKKMQEAAKDLHGDFDENDKEENTDARSVPVTMPDLILPASFDFDNPTYRYRSLHSSNSWVVKPVLDQHGCITVESMFVVEDKVPISFSSQISKDKTNTNLQMDIASSMKHGKVKATYLGFDTQSDGHDMAYTLRSRTRFSLEATLKDKVYPLGRFCSTFGFFCHGLAWIDMAIGCNSQIQIPVGRNTDLIIQLNINDRRSGQVSV